MRSRCGVARERLRVADVDEAREQLERVLEALAGRPPAAQAEGQDARRLAGLADALDRVVCTSA